MELNCDISNYVLGWEKEDFIRTLITRMEEALMTLRKEDLKRFSDTEGFVKIGKDFIYGMLNDFRDEEVFYKSLKDFINKQGEIRQVYIASSSDIRKWITYYEIIEERER